MNQLLIKYSQFIDRQPLKIRVLILATFLSLTFVIWYYGFWQNLHHSISVTTNRLSDVKTSLVNLNKQLTTIEQEVKELTGFLSKEKTDSTTKVATLSPHKTIKIIHDLLITTNNLVLIQFKNLPPKEITLTQPTLRLFEHDIIIKFSGDYFSTMNYLQAIEKLDWKIFWDKLEYKVVQYPAAEVTLYMHTISSEGEWIHV